MKEKKRSGSLDYHLVLATVGILFCISVISIYGMFSFKFAAVQQLPAPEKIAYMNRMNTLVAPFVVGLILVLGVCVPRRLLPDRWLGWAAAALGCIFLGVSLWTGVRAGLLIVLAASLALQLIVLVMAATGSSRLHFTKTGYWVRVGSSLVHLGLILFVLDLLLHRHATLHFALFWVTTGASVLGMLCCFYAPGVARLARRFIGPAS
ncbi:MAG: hypothetical protein Kow0089_15800 [Desulfobulbaceae bacterium]